ncbi:hypothetical protein HY638_03180 [Candidatus Woesearchaeota archaeon]|nr:hypothetical protein [Candidatus Woesearchaeota archaeon]
MKSDSIKRLLGVWLPMSISASRLYIPPPLDDFSVSEKVRALAEVGPEVESNKRFQEEMKNEGKKLAAERNKLAASKAREKLEEKRVHQLAREKNEYIEKFRRLREERERNVSGEMMKVLREKHKRDLQAEIERKKLLDRLMREKRQRGIIEKKELQESSEKKLALEKIEMQKKRERMLEIKLLQDKKIRQKEERERKRIAQLERMEAIGRERRAAINNERRQRELQMGHLLKRLREEKLASEKEKIMQVEGLKKEKASLEKEKNEILGSLMKAREQLRKLHGKVESIEAVSAGMERRLKVMSQKPAGKEDIERLGGEKAVLEKEKQNISHSLIEAQRALRESYGRIENLESAKAELKRKLGEVSSAQRNVDLEELHKERHKLVMGLGRKYEESLARAAEEKENEMKNLKAHYENLLAAEKRKENALKENKNNQDMERIRHRLGFVINKKREAEARLHAIEKENRRMLDADLAKIHNEEHVIKKLRWELEKASEDRDRAHRAVENLRAARADAEKRLRRISERESSELKEDRAAIAAIKRKLAEEKKKEREAEGLAKIAVQEKSRLLRQRRLEELKWKGLMEGIESKRVADSHKEIGRAIKKVKMEPVEEEQDLKKINSMIYSCRDKLSEFKLREAKDIYLGILSIYQRLPDSRKNAVYDHIREIYQERKIAENIITQ